MKILSDFKDRCSSSLIPLQATLELTYKCNERCSHCYLATYDDKEDGRPPFTLPEWKSALDQLAKAGTLYIILIGGEAMTHPFFWQIAEYAAELNFAVSLITNGLLMNEEAASRIAEIGFFEVTTSLYSLNPSIHDKMTRRKGSHVLTLGAIDRLTKRGVRIGINCLLTSENIESYFELEEWAAHKNIKIRFDPVVTPKSDGDISPTLTRASSEQLFHFYRKLKLRGTSIAPPPVGPADDPVCNAGRGKCAINAYGDLLTCLEVRDAIGSLREGSFEDLWMSPKAEFLRSYKNKDLKFDTSCGSGAGCDHCPGIAGAETGDRMAPVPYLMEVARIKQQITEES